MSEESGRPIAPAESSSHKDLEPRGEPPLVADNSRMTAAILAKTFRAAGIGCEIVDLVPAKAAVLERDRVVIVLAIALLTGLAWGYLLWLSADMNMGGMDMAGLRMIPSGMGLMMPADMPWTAIEFAFVFAMWTVMMAGMMTPSAAPMFLTYARVGRQTEAQRRPLIATAWFAAGYFLVWVGFSAFATLVQWSVERAGLLDFAMTSTSNLFAGLLFVAAGLYQWTPLNEKCLTECQRPFAFVMRHGGYRGDAPGCVMLGLRHGAYCVGCCWTLMALLLAGGVMNVLWIALLALLAFLERVTSMGRLIARLAGVAIIAGSAWLFSKGMP
jgi:predicted metal-binding membrane protein